MCIYMNVYILPHALLSETNPRLLHSVQDCNDHHTAAFTGQHLYTPWLCPTHEANKERTKWNRDARSVRCCSGHPITPWCRKMKKPHDCQ